MSNQNRFLLPSSASANNTASISSTTSSSSATTKAQQQQQGAASSSSSTASTTSIANKEEQENQSSISVDTDFDSYWEEEARNPHRNRIRIGRQYQATVPGLLKGNSREQDRKKSEDLETLSFCPKRSAKISNSELDHFFTVAKSLNLFASLVETRSLLGRDVTIADLNHIRRKEGLSLASVIQPVRQAASVAALAISNLSSSSPQSSQSAPAIASTTTTTTTATISTQQQSPQKSPTNESATALASDLKQSESSSLSPPSSTSVAASPREIATTMNQPLMKALSHFISLHHPCHHDANCKKLQKDLPFEQDDNDRPSVSITAGNLRQYSSSSSSSSSGNKTDQSKSGRSRSSMKQQQQQLAAVKQEVDQPQSQEQQAGGDQPSSEQQQQQQSDNIAQQQSPSIEDWTREEVELFSKAIEVCGKNFGSIKKDFLPSKSVRSIVKFYYIGSRDPSDNKKTKLNQQQQQQQQQQSTTATLDQSVTITTSNPVAGDTCSSPEKSNLANNNGQGGGGAGGSSTTTGSKGGGTNSTATNSTNNPSSSSSSSLNDPSVDDSTTNNPNKNQTEQTSSNQQQQQQRQLDTNTDQASLQQSRIKIEPATNSKTSNQQGGKSITTVTADQINGAAAQTKNIDARMSVYNFDDEFKDDESPSVPLRLECPKPGAEVKPLKAKPIIPNSAADGTDNNNSNVGSLKFFMDGQLVLKLNACQDQQEGAEKCHWVQSGERHVSANRQKRYTKRSSEKLTNNTNTDANQNGSQSNSVVSSCQDDDSKNDDLSGNDDDSKESMNSFTNSTQQQQQQQQQQQHQQQQQQQHQNQHQHQHQPRANNNNNNQQQQQQHSPNSKRLKVANNSDPPNLAHNIPIQQQHLNHYQPQQQQQLQQQQQQLPSPVDYKRLALNNRIKAGQNDSIRSNSASAISQAMPWLQANSFAMAAALLGGLPFPAPPPGNMIQETQQTINNNNNIANINNNINNNNNNTLNSKPMDLSVEHHNHHHSPPKALTPKSTSRSRSRSKNN